MKRQIHRMIRLRRINHADLIIMISISKFVVVICKTFKISICVRTFGFTYFLFYDFPCGLSFLNVWLIGKFWLSFFYLAVIRSTKKNRGQPESSDDDDDGEDIAFTRGLYTNNFFVDDVEVDNNFERNVKGHYVYSEMDVADTTNTFLLKNFIKEVVLSFKRRVVNFKIQSSNGIDFIKLPNGATICAANRYQHLHQLLI